MRGEQNCKGVRNFQAMNSLFGFSLLSTFYYVPGRWRTGMGKTKGVLIEC